MSVKYDRVTRRQFLIGTGGYFLVLPFLPSLLSREALAQVVTKPRRLLVATHGHNVMSSQIINPALATQVTASGAKQVKLSTLNGVPLTNYLTHSTYAALKSAGLVSMIRGLDCVTDQSGHGSMWLTGVINTNPTIPSVDSYMEASQSVYPTASSSGYLRKVIRCNEAYSYKKVGSTVSPINDVYADNNNNDWNGAKRFYDEMLGRFTTSGGTTTPAPTPAPTTDQMRRNILNDVFSAFQTAKGSRRISANDKSRLDEHMQSISELQSSIVITPPTPPPLPAGQACNNPTSSGIASGAKSSYTSAMEVYMKLMRVALTCNLTKVGYLGFSGHASYDIGTNRTIFPTSNPLHNGVFHNEGGYTFSEIETHFTYWMKWHMDAMATHIIEPLRTMEDVQTNNGGSYMDNMLVALLSEAGVHQNPGEHSNVDYMPILFGNMGGVIASDKLVVYDRPTGLPYNTLLITLLEAMGVPASEYQAGSSNGKGFGQYVSSGAYVTKHGSRMYSPIAEIWNG